MRFSLLRYIQISSSVEFLKVLWCSYSQNIPLSLFLSGDVFTLWPSSAPVNGKTMKLLNDLDIASDGTIYMSDSSTKWDRRHNRYCIMEADNSGRYCIVSWNFSLTLATNIWACKIKDLKHYVTRKISDRPMHLHCQFARTQCMDPKVSAASHLISLWQGFTDSLTGSKLVKKLLGK